MKRKKLNDLLENRWFYVLLVLITCLIIFININIERHSKYSLDDTVFEGILTNLKITDTKISYTIDGEEQLICNYYLEEREDVSNIRSQYKLGIKVRVAGTLGLPLNNTIPNTFNYKEYLYNHGIFYTCTMEDIEVIDNKIGILYEIKNFIIDRIMTFEMKDYMFTLIIGDKSLLDSETFEKYRKNGVTHLFAISGMHIGLFAGVIIALLEKMHFDKKRKYIITLIFIWLYAFLTGFSPSVLRACTLFTILSVFKIFDLKVDTLKVLIMTGCILLLSNYRLIYDLGFIYSFSTTFGLLYSGKIISKHKVLGTSLVATLYSLPITIQNFFKVNLLSTFFNIVFVPFVSVIVYPLCLLTFVLRFLSPITSMAIFFLEMLNDYLAKLDFLYIVIPKMNVFLVILYYLVLMFGLKKRFYKTAIILVAIVILNKSKPLLDPNYYVIFLDVGQGDSALLISPHSKEIILIDTGGKENFGSNKNSYLVTTNTITYLNSLGIDRIDYMILTHGDYDHAGESTNLVDNFKVEKVIFNCGPFNNLENKLINMLKDKKTEYYACIQELNVGNDKLHFLNTKEYDNENDNSIVIYTELNDYKFLFMGDASSVTEKEILNKHSMSNIDVFKVGHHGSKTSSSIEFINEINPKYSIISVGKNNRYGHPNKEVLDNLNSSKIYRTDLEGSVEIKLNKNGYEIKNYGP